jgi:serine/threonine protein kinase
MPSAARRAPLGGPTEVAAMGAARQIRQVPETPPTSIGKYQITDILGRGAMGVVYRALDPALNRHVAIKVMSHGIAADQELRDRFMREARAAGSLQHPNIITIYDFGEAEGALYIAMEYVEGSDLSEIMERHDPLPLTGKIDIIVDVLRALDYAHARRVVHRDVKPANIRVSVDGRAKLMDFGIARLEKSDLTKSGMMIGTPDYMAPEQISGGEITPATDVFAVGAVLYELLTAQRTFDGETLHSVLYKVMHEHPPPLREVASTVPASLQPILDRALAKDPASRYATAGAMAHALEAVRAALSGGATVAVVARATPLQTARMPGRVPRSKRRGGRRFVVWIGAGGGVVALAAAAVLVVSSRRPGPRLPAMPESSRVAAAPARSGPDSAAAPSAVAAAPAASAEVVPEGRAPTVALPPSLPPPTTRARRERVPARSQAAERGEEDLQADRRNLRSAAPVNRADTGVRPVGLPPPAGRAAPAESAATAAPGQGQPAAPATPPVTVPAPQPAPVSAAPQPAAPSPSPPAAPVNPRPQVDALVAAYARAIEFRNIQEMRRLYPGMTSQQEQFWHTFFRAVRGPVKAQLTVARLEVSGATAVVEGIGVYEYEDAGGSHRQERPFHATAALEGGAWRFTFYP